MNVLAFDIETIPDVDSGRRLHELEGLVDDDIAHVMFNKRREETGSEFLPPHLHKVVVISAVYRSTTRDELSIWTMGDNESTEKDMLTCFFDFVARRTPTLVTWNGEAFDLPILHHRGLINQVPAGRY